MFWGSISVFGPGSLVPISGMMNSQRYIETLESHLLSVASSWFGNEEWTLVQDNAPCHTSQITRRFLEERNIHVLPWPSNSPDMNIIENIWNIWKKKFTSQEVGKLVVKLLLKPNKYGNVTKN